MIRVRWVAVAFLVAVSSLWAESAWAQCVTFIHVDSSGQVVEPVTALDCHPDYIVGWVVFSSFGSPVKVDFVDFKRRANGAAADPLTPKSPKTLNVNPNELEVGKSNKVKDESAPGLIDGYKYTIVVTSGGKELDRYDPDLDVTPPPSFLYPKLLKGIKKGKEE